jgi:hypothetical protein
MLQEGTGDETPQNSEADFDGRRLTFISPVRRRQHFMDDGPLADMPSETPPQECGIF